MEFQSYTNLSGPRIKKLNGDIFGRLRTVIIDGFTVRNLYTYSGGCLGFVDTAGANHATRKADLIEALNAAPCATLLAKSP
jgi:hypothetical protein